MMSNPRRHKTTLAGAIFLLLAITVLALFIRGQVRDKLIVEEYLAKTHLVENEGLDHALRLAVEAKDYNAIDALIEAGANIDRAEALQHAVNYGDKQVLNHLLEKGADPDARPYGRTALHDAAEKGATGCTTLLLDSDADPSIAVPKDKLTALHYAVKGNHQAIVELLIENGAELNMKDAIGFTPLDWAIREEHSGVEEFLRKHGAKTAVDWKQNRR